ncbi:MAG: hypothetical protein H6626_03260 [Pseudobdellovibrionaceae bacterium]|nr:MAG: hypothetical protein H6626_03260 [Pseudobdellovibrionaceae bacterium]
MAHIQCSMVIPGERSEVFQYVTALENQPLLLEDTIEAENLNGDRILEKDAEYSFLMCRMHFSQPVRLYVTEFIPGDVLTYRQTEGLFEKWVHTMKFTTHGPGETLVTDLVEYAVPMGILGNLADDLFIRKDMGRVLKARLAHAAEYFERRRDAREMQQNLGSAESG